MFGVVGDSHPEGIAEAIDQLSPFSTLPLTELNDQKKNEFHKIQRYAEWTRGTEDYKSLFPAPETKGQVDLALKPNTVGSFLEGCTVEPNTCAPLCAGSLLHPHQTPCDQMVITGVMVQGEYQWYVNETGNKSVIGLSGPIQALVYLYSPFDGLVKEDKAFFLKHKVDQVKIMTQSGADGMWYARFEPLDAFIPIDQIPSRSAVIKCDGPCYTEKDTSGSAWVVGLIVIVILILIIVMARSK